MEPLPAFDLFGKFQNETEKLVDWTAPETEPTGAPLLTADLKGKLAAQIRKMSSKRSGEGEDDHSGEGVKEMTEEPKSGLSTTTTTGGSGIFGASSFVNNTVETSINRDAAAAGLALGDEGGFFFSFKKDAAATVETSHAMTMEVAKQVTNRKGKTRTVTTTITRNIPLWTVKRLGAGKFYSENPLVGLHQEVSDFIDFMAPTPQEIFLRRMVEWEVRTIAKSAWPDCEVIVYGSMDTGLLLPLSDIDMSILNVPVSQEEALKYIAGQVAAQGLCEEAFPNVILKTKVPLVKYLHKTLKVDVDISINAGDGRVNSEKVKELLKEYPGARQLILVIKYFLQQRTLDVPFTGGMGSFAMTILVISFLQHHPSSTGKQDPALCGLGRLLVDFLYYYGRCFNYQRVGVSVSDGGFYFMKPPQESPASPTEGGRPRAPPAVLVEDPGNQSNNATSSLRKMQQIVPMFENAWIYLTAFSPPPDEATADETVTPSSAEVVKRPTLLSRILHSDAELVLRRKDMEQAYEEIIGGKMSGETVEAIRQYRPVDDEALLSGGCALSCSGPNTIKRDSEVAGANRRVGRQSGGGVNQRRKRSRSQESGMV